MALLNDVREVMGGTLRMLGYSTTQRTNRKSNKLMKRRCFPAIAAFDTAAWQNQILAGSVDVLLGRCDPSKQREPQPQVLDSRSGSSLWTDTMVTENRSQPDAAYAWINFMLQPQVVCQRLGFATPNRVAVEQLPAQVRNNPNLFPPESILQNCERIAPLGKFDMSVTGLS